MGVARKGILFMWNYTDKVHDHFLNPRNVGSIENADAVGEVGSLACGDALKLYLKIERGQTAAEDRIVDAKFQTFGCASAIASSSVLTELIIGKTVDEALKVTNQDIAETLGGLPKEKMHCSIMGQEALEAAIANWRGGSAKPLHHEGQIVCKCFGVTDETIIRAIKENHLTTLEEVTNYTKAGGACGLCHGEIQKILDETLGKTPMACLTEIKPVKRMTNVQRMQLVMQTLDEVVRPRLRQDGGDVELVDLDGKVVYVAFRGVCMDCPSSHVTLKEVVEKALQEHVEDDLTVKEVAQ